MRSIPEFGNFEVHIMRLTLSTLVFGLLVAQGAMAAGDGTAAVGGGLGGALGNVVGQQMGGSTGAAIGAGVGGGAGRRRTQGQSHRSGGGRWCRGGGRLGGRP